MTELHCICLHSLSWRFPFCAISSCDDLWLHVTLYNRDLDLSAVQGEHAASRCSNTHRQGHAITHSPHVHTHTACLSLCLPWAWQRVTFELAPSHTHAGMCRSPEKKGIRLTEAGNDVMIYVDLHSTGLGCQCMQIIMCINDHLSFYLSAAVFLRAEGVVWGRGAGRTAWGARGRAGEEERTVKRTSGETEAFSEEGPQSVPPCRTGATGAARASEDGRETCGTSSQCHFTPTQPSPPQIHTWTVSSNTHIHTHTHTPSHGLLQTAGQSLNPIYWPFFHSFLAIN